MSDLVVNVRQVSSYPLATSVPPNATLLLQNGGLGSPYMSATAQTLVATALQANGGPIGIGVTPPSPADGTQAFGGWFAALNGFFINTYFNGTDIAAWQSGPVGVFDFETGTGNFQWQVQQGQAGVALPPLSQVMRLTMAGALQLPHGTLTVARDPAAALEVATMGWVGNHTVASFNNRIGVVQLTSSDVYGALCLDSAIATQTWVCTQLNNAFQAMLQGTVVRWNGRMGNVFLMLSDISCVFMQPGQQPITQTPPSTSDDYSIANTAWVVQYVTETLTGGGTGLGLATEAWVQANTVASFNGRIGAVTLALSDITNAGGAPLNSPQLSGIPTAPTQAVGNATSAIATTAFVWSAVQESTTGVVSFNGRTGVITLDGTDINDAGGALLNSPAFTGVPTAPTAATGTTTTQLATCAFVLNEVQAIGAGVTSFNTRSGNVVLELTDIEGAGGAPIASPAFSGTPTVPTPVSPVAATTTIANTNWVVQYCALNTVASFNGRIGAVTLNANDITAVGGLANPNVALTGAPTAPTLVPGTSSTGIATTAFVQQAIQNIGGITVSPTPPATPFVGQAWFNSTAGVQQLNVWTGTAWVPSTNLSGYLPLSGGQLTGNLGVANMAVPSPLQNGGLATPNIVLPLATNTSPAFAAFNCFPTNNANGLTAIATGAASWLGSFSTGFQIAVAAGTAGTPISTTVGRFGWIFGQNGTLIGPNSLTPSNANLACQISAANFLLPISTPGSTTVGGTGGFCFNSQWLPGFAGWASVNAGAGSVLGLNTSGQLVITVFAAVAAGANFTAASAYTFDAGGNVGMNGTLSANSATLSQNVECNNVVTSVATIGGVVFNGAQNLWPTGNNVSSCGTPGFAWNTVAAYSFNQQSDPRGKKDIALSPAGALAKVLAIPVKTYRWLAEAETAPVHTGWDATDVQAQMGNAPVVDVGTDQAQSLSLNTSEMMAWLWQAVQELAAQVKAQQPA